MFKSKIKKIKNYFLKNWKNWWSQLVEGLLSTGPVQFLKYSLKYAISLKYPKNTSKYTNNIRKFILCSYPGTFTKKEYKKATKKENLQQKTVWLGKQIYTSPKSFTQAALPMMLEIFIRYVLRWIQPSSYPSVFFHGRILYLTILIIQVSLMPNNFILVAVDR